MPEQEQPTYQSYLIRFQRAEGQSRWRATLHDTHSTRVLHFATEMELVRHLLTVLDVPSDQQLVDSK